MSYDPQPEYPPTRPLNPAQPPQPMSGAPYGHPYPPQPGYGYPPPQPGQPSWMPPPVAPVKKTWTGKRIVMAAVGGVLVLCCGGAGLAVLTDDAPTTTTSTSTGETGGSKPADGAPAAQNPEKAPAEKPAENDTFNVPTGTKITHADDGDTIEAVMRSVKTHKKGCNSLGVDPENGLFVVVDVVVTQTKGKGSVNPLDFTFVAEDGTSANALSAAFSGCDEPSLASADLRAGQKRAGKIAFDIGMKQGSLEWAPGGLGADTVGSWAVK
jgi:Domain of unknown function (DUF4352)